MSDSSIRNRDLKLDILKGIGIILMVVRHARAPYSDFVLLFHMALFFIASGYLLKSDFIKDGNSLFQYVRKKVKGLWKPYFEFTCLFVLCNNLFVRLNVYTDNPNFMNCNFIENPVLMHTYSIMDILKRIIKAVFFQTGTQMGGALWFFYALFLVLVLYNLIGYLLKKISKKDSVYLILQGVVSALFLGLGYFFFLSNKEFFGISRCLSVYCLIYIGYIMKNSQLMNKLCCSKLKIVVSIIVSAVILLLGYRIGYISIDSNTIENPVFFILMSISGWILIYSVSHILDEYNVPGIKILTYLSKHSVWIIALHFLCFKLISLIQIYIYGYELYCLAAFPVLNSKGMWWLLYTIVGLIIPLIFEMVFDKLFSFITGKNK